MAKYLLYFVSQVFFFQSLVGFVITPPETIANTHPAETNVYCSCDPTTGHYLATWSDSTTQQTPTYSFYTPETGWSIPEAIPGGSQVDQSVFSIYIPSNGTFLAIWANSTNQLAATYSIYTPGTGWDVNQSVIPNTVVGQNVYLSLNPLTGQVLGTWGEGNSSIPSYAYYTPGTGWGSVTPFPNAGEAESDVITSFDQSGNGMATWLDVNSGFLPVYSLYSPTSGWTTLAQIPGSNVTYFDIYVSCNPTTGQFLAMWQDYSNGSAPTYAFYTPNSGWSSIGTIPNSTVYSDIIPIFDPASGQFLALWADPSNGNQVTYSIYTEGTGWSNPTLVSPSSTTSSTYNIFPAYDSVNGQILATWSDGSNNQYPTFSFFIGPLPPPSGPDAPASFSGTQFKNQFLTQSDLINWLTWTPAGDPTISSYLLRRNGRLIFQSSATGPFSYQDHHRQNGVETLYQLTSQNGSGDESSPLFLSL